MTGPAREGGDEDGARGAARSEPAFNLPMVVVALIALCSLVHLLRVYALSPQQDLGLLLRTAFIPVRYSGQFDLDIYAFTSTVTYSFLHGSVMHLAVNMVWLAAFGSPLAFRLGAPRFLLFWVFTAVSAALMHYVLHMNDHAPLVGASGAISGMMGAAARFGFRVDRRSDKPTFAGEMMPVTAVFKSRAVVTFLTVWMVVNLITGVSGFVPGSDNPIAWEAHVGGFFAGFFCVGWFDKAGAPPTALDEL
jgi:membrane associated rhomboid family serine protease